METLILVASMTGTAEILGEDILAGIAAGRATMLLAERADIGMVRDCSTLLVISSTYGNGEVPEPAKAFFERLEAEPMPDANLRFAVIGLGDKSLYPGTFANGGRLWDAMLAKKGFDRIVEPLFIDCSAMADPAEQSIAWVGSWLDTVSQASLDETQ